MTTTTLPKAKIAIGNTAKRTVAAGGSWIGKGQVMASFEDAIPAAWIQENLLNWEPLEVPTANIVPCGVEDADYILPDGTPAKVMVRKGAKGIIRSDNHSPLGQFKGTPGTGEGYDSSSYGRMVNFTQEALQGSLPIWNAGELRNGAQFFITVGMDEMMHDSHSGIDFLPYLMFRSSLDGSLAHTWTPGSVVATCDNMFAGMQAAARDAARLVKFKRSRFSLTDARVNDLRSALGVLQLQAEATSAFFGSLVDVELNRPQWIQVLDVIEPLPAEGASKTTVTKTENRRQVIDALYQNSPMVAPWTGTAFGAVQAFNTYEHHEKNVRGMNRVERVFDRVIRGDMAKADNKVIDALEQVLGRELVTT